MLVSDLVQNFGMKIVTSEDFEDRTINGCYIGDLLSWVMSHVQEGDVWITVQTNMNVVAVAALTECACVVIPEGIEVDIPTVQKANAQGITILSAQQNSFQLALEIGKAL